MICCDYSLVLYHYTVKIMRVHYVRLDPTLFYGPRCHHQLHLFCNHIIILIASSFVKIFLAEKMHLLENSNKMFVSIFFSPVAPTLWGTLIQPLPPKKSPHQKHIIFFLPASVFSMWSGNIGTWYYPAAHIIGNNRKWFHPFTLLRWIHNGWWMFTPFYFARSTTVVGSLMRRRVGK